MAHADGYLPRDITSHLDAPMALTEPAEKKTVSIEQFVSVRNLLDERERLAFDLAYFCGLRASEILGLRIGDLRRAPDGQQYLRIQRSFHKGAVNRPKTEASTRNVGIAPPVREQLVKWNANLPATSPDSWVFPSMSITTRVA